MGKGKEPTTVIVPGEYVALIEEFEGGKNTYVLDGNIRSATVGLPMYDLKRHIVKIKQKNSPMLAKIGDTVVGYIEMLFGSMMSVRILYLNEKKSISGFSAIASTRVALSGSGWSRGERKSRVIFRVGDIIRGRVISLLNSTIHITIDEKEYGVIYTLCFNCGGDTVRINNAIKCIECGAQEERKLTNDYGKETIRLIHKRSAK
ncbi:MAG: exosome complex RNA-binding protein Csl4 [Nitrososphaeraceae archaeon]